MFPPWAACGARGLREVENGSVSAAEDARTQRLACKVRKMYTCVYYLKTRATRMANPIDGGGNPCRGEDLIATGEVLRTPSTRKGNRGGQSVQEGFVDRAGRAVTRHTIYDVFGRIVHGPHFRPGGFR